MKITKHCPKCNSKDVLSIQGERQGYGRGNNIKVGIIGQVTPTKYVCCDCGFIEEWIDDPNDLLKIKKSHG